LAKDHAASLEKSSLPIEDGAKQVEMKWQETVQNKPLKMF
jgi:hypothetical protein